MTKTLGEWLECASEVNRVDLGLERIQEVAARLECQFDCPVILVAGTNGKGSCVAALAAAYRSAGYKTASTCSPHLFDFKERAQINQVPLPEALWCQAFEAVALAKGEVPLTYFEWTTLAGFVALQAESPDVAVIEVGLGGRLDASNIVDPAVSVITTVAMDHMDFLGDTREAIAREKAGIFRASRQAIVGQKADMPITREIASALGCHYQVAPYSTRMSPLSKASLGVAEAAIAALQDRLPVPETALSVWEHAVLPGRFQEKMLSGKKHIFDLAHNPEAAHWLADRLSEERPEGKTFALWSSFKDKDLSGIASALKNQIDVWFVCGSDNPRSANATQHKMVLTELGVSARNIRCFTHPERAYEQLFLEMTPEDRVVIFGGFHIVSACLSQEEEFCYG